MADRRNRWFLMRRISWCLLWSLVLPLFTVFTATNAYAADGACSNYTSVDPGEGGFGLSSSDFCDTYSAGDNSKDSSTPVVQAPPTKTIDCGPPTYTTGGGTPDTVDDPCRPAKVDCAVVRGTPVDPTITTVVTYVFDGTTWRLNNVNCASKPAAGGPALTGEAIREQAIELLPSVPIRSAPADGNTFVNMQTILWLDSPSSRALGPVALLGHQIGIQIAVQSVKWDFGDGNTANGPLGQSYDGACATKECPGFWGHDYASVGTPAVSATVYWTATYSLDGGPAQPVPGGPISRGNTTLPLTVRQARGVLVPNPGE
jgi:hypothetical protein